MEKNNNSINNNAKYINTNNEKSNDLSFIKLTKNDVLKQINNNIIYPQINIITKQNYKNKITQKSKIKKANKNLI